MVDSVGMKKYRPTQIIISSTYNLGFRAQLKISNLKSDYYLELRSLYISQIIFVKSCQ